MNQRPYDSRPITALAAKAISEKNDLAVSVRRLLNMIDGLPWHIRGAVYEAYNERVGVVPGSLPEPIAFARRVLDHETASAKAEAYEPDTRLPSNNPPRRFKTRGAK